MEKVLLNSMFENLLHIWNKTNFWNPKMKPYIYGSVNGVHVFNLVKTVNKIEEVKAELAKLSSEWKKVLFVATKLQARDAFKDLAIETGNDYVCEKWVPGLLTNFKTIKKRIATYLKLLKDSQTGGLEILTKKEKAAKLLELAKLDKSFGWLKEMKQLPDIIFVVDGAYEAQAVKEARALKIPAYGIANTNTDIDTLVNLIPANTNSVKSTKYIASELKSSFKKIAPKNNGTVWEKAKKIVEKKVTPTEKIEK